MMLMATGTMLAQNYDTEVHHSDTLTKAGLHNVGWIRSHPLDNYFVNLQGGGQLYYGYEDMKGPFFDRLTGNVEFHVGRWTFPMMGYRFGAGLGYAHGFISQASYTANRTELIANGSYGTSYGTSGEGNALGCYYWPFDNDNTLLMQKWNYVYAGADLLVNLSNMKEYNRVNLDRRWNNIAYVGVAIRMGLSENHPEVTNQSNFAAEGKLGYIGRYYLTKNLSVYGDVRLSIIEGLFDREFLPDVEVLKPDLILNCHVGLSYEFNMRSQAKRDYDYAQMYGDNGGAKSTKFKTFVQREDVDIINIVDSIIIYRTDTIDDVVTLNLIDSLENELRKIINVHTEAVGEDTPLDSILMKRLLPYEMVFFELDRWDIQGREELKIARMAQIMKAYPKATFILTGSADSATGTVNRNWFLSHNRADVVYNRLVEGYGIDPKQLKREYLGGIGDYEPFQLNRATVIIMDHKAVRKAFEEMKRQHRAGGGVSEEF